jgi:AcrR family transcriptional regulator
VAKATTRVWRGMTGEERHAERQRRIVQAGLEVFGTTGYASSSIPEICRLAGVSSASFYEHFPQKEDLLLAVYDEVVTGLAHEVVAALQGPPSSVGEQTRKGLTAFTAPFVEDARKARLNFIEVVGATDRVEQRRREVLRTFARVTEQDLERTFAAGGREPRDFSIVAMALVGATQEVLVDWFATPEPARRPMPEVIEHLVAVYVGAADGAPPRRDGTPG